MQTGTCIRPLHLSVFCQKQQLVEPNVQYFVSDQYLGIESLLVPFTTYKQSKNNGLDCYLIEWLDKTDLFIV